MNEQDFSSSNPKTWSSVKTLKNIADAYSSVYEKKEYETSRDKDEDGDNDFADNMIARMVASGMSREEAIKKVKNKDYNIGEATAMSKRGLNEPEIRKEIASKTKGGSFADKATALADRQTYGDTKKKEGREKLARKQRGDFRDTTSSNPGLHGYAYKATTDADKEKQAARGKQRGVLTPNERTKLNMEYDLYDIILSHLLDEGYADTEQAAEAIMVNMSEDWRESIVEAKVDEKLPEHERSGARLDRYDNPSGALALGGGQQRARREEHRERRGKKKD